MNNDLIYPVRMIFNSESEEGVLNQMETEAFFIAPYQRGYKWSADSEGPVNRLLNDLFGAFEAGSGEYYLQYITTKKSRYNGQAVLEVIDGQQRLTTLTLLFSVFSYLDYRSDLNFTKNKLRYQVRENVARFIDDFIYQNIQFIQDTNWKKFVAENPAWDEQDIYYLFNAVQAIFAFLDPLESNRLAAFSDFVADNVKIILNNISRTISSEKIFNNLNSNKVELTDVELVKGLFLTKAAREKVMSRKPGYQQIAETRALIGRQWDELVSWASDPEVQTIFFNGENVSINGLLSFLAKAKGFQADGSKNERYQLFNFFLDQVNTGKSSVGSLFSELKSYQMILDNWFRNDEIYNTLGFLMHCKGSQFETGNLLPLLKIPLPRVKRKLKKMALNMLPSDIENLDYNEHDHPLHAVLLALNVFLGNTRFNFRIFAEEKWSLEHIFPQKPRDLPLIMQSDDVKLIRDLMRIPLEQKSELQKAYGQFDEQVYNLLVHKMAKFPVELSEQEKELLYRFINSKSLNGIGNMALLTGSDNSSNSNGMFFKKRHNMIKRISKGSFVPKHTYDVFSKLLSDKMNKDTGIWSEQDMLAHRSWILERIQNLHKELEVQS